MKKLRLILILVFSAVLLVGCGGVVTPDTTAPIITLIGASTIDIYVDDVYTDAGAIASDNVDGDITENIVTVNPVDTSTVGTYIIAYNVSDVAGNPATEVIRTVNVVDIVEILQLIKEYTGCEQVVRWADGEVSVCDTTGQTKEIWNKINEIIDGPVVFKLTDDTSAQIGIEYWPVGGTFFVGFSGTSNNIFKGCGIGINPETVSEEVFVEAILTAVGIFQEKAALGFSNEVKKVLYWLYRLEPGYPLT